MLVSVRKMIIPTLIVYNTSVSIDFDLIEFVAESENLDLLITIGDLVGTKEEREELANKYLRRIYQTWSLLIKKVI